MDQPKPFTEIRLNQNKVVLIDLEDYERVKAHNWTAAKSRNAKGRDASVIWYAVTHVGRWSEPITRMHVFLMGRRSGFVIDHKNGNGLDNRRTNLRWATVAQNVANQRKRVGGTSRFRGVCFDKARGDWVAGYTINRKRINLGRFQSEEDAALAYDAAVLVARGEFACLNFQKDGPNQA